MCSLLNPEDVPLLALYLHDEMTQNAIARKLGVPQTNVSHRIRRAVAVLEAAGFTVIRPARRSSRPRWKPKRVITVPVDPSALSRMLTSTCESGAVRGVWRDANSAGKGEGKMNRSDEPAPRGRR